MKKNIIYAAESLCFGEEIYSAVNYRFVLSSLSYVQYMQPCGRLIHWTIDQSDLLSKRIILEWLLFASSKDLCQGLNTCPALKNWFLWLNHQESVSIRYFQPLSVHSNLVVLFSELCGDVSIFSPVSCILKLPAHGFVGVPCYYDKLLSVKHAPTVVVIEFWQL